MIKSSEGQKFDVEHTIAYVVMKKKECEDWNFDEITGGEESFVDKKEYNELKKWFEQKYKE